MPTYQDHLLIIRLGSVKFGLDIQATQEVDRVPKIIPVPSTATDMIGVATIRGRNVPIIDLRMRLGLEATEYVGTTRVVVVSSYVGLIGLLVDEVTEVARISTESNEISDYFIETSWYGYLRDERKVISFDGKLLYVLDLDKVLNT